MAKNKTKMVATKKSLRQRMYEYRWIYFLEFRELSSYSL